MFGWPSVSLLVWFSFRSHYWVWRPLLEAGSLGFRTDHLRCRCVNSLNSQAGRMGIHRTGSKDAWRELVMVLILHFVLY